LAIFYKGVFFLAASAFFGECIEFIINMILARELGKHGLGLYMSILPTIFLIVLLSSFELQVSISKFIAEKESRFHRSILHHAIVIAIIFTICLFFLAMFIVPLVPLINAYHPFTRWLVIVLIPIISFTSVARGYFMGKQDMGRIAFSNFVRKVFQLIVLFLVFRFFHFETEKAVLITIATLIGSEGVVFLYLVLAFTIQYQHMKHLPFSNINRKVIRKKLMAVSIPTTGLRLFSAVTGAIQPFIIKEVLIRSGLTSFVATEQFGIMAGMAMSIGFFPGFIAHSLLIALIPTVSKAYSIKDYVLLRKILDHVLKLTLFYGVLAVSFFYLFAHSLTSLFFHSIEAAFFLQMLWPFFLFHFFIIPMQAFLIGLGLLKDIFFQTFWSTALAFSIIIWFGSLPEWRMEGVIMGLNSGAILLAVMHYVTICKKVRVSIFTRNLVQKS
jgi:stage V sporulation protein B